MSGEAGSNEAADEDEEGGSGRRSGEDELPGGIKLADLSEGVDDDLSGDGVRGAGVGEE